MGSAEMGREAGRNGRQERFARELHDARSQGFALLAVKARGRRGALGQSGARPRPPYWKHGDSRFRPDAG